MTELIWPTTTHAEQRLLQRNLSARDIALVTRFGRVAYATHATFYFLGERDVPRGWARELARLVGTTLVIVDGCLVTAYRNRRAWRAIKRKSKWSWGDDVQACRPMAWPLDHSSESQ
ncbi:MAG: DUF4258 domain-containing protein [Blastocatellia bacterium]